MPFIFECQKLFHVVNEKDNFFNCTVLAHFAVEVLRLIARLRAFLARKSAKDIFLTCLVLMKQVERSENALLVSDFGLILS